MAQGSLKVRMMPSYCPCHGERREMKRDRALTHFRRQWNFAAQDVVDAASLVEFVSYILIARVCQSMHDDF